MFSAEGLEDKYSVAKETVKFHRFKHFTNPRGPYIPFWIHDIYTTYCDLFPNSKKKAIEFTVVKAVMVRGKEVGCSNEYINYVLDRDMHCTHPYYGLPIAQSLHDLKGWLAPFISNNTPKRTEVGIPIKKVLTIGFISNTIMTS